MLGFLSTEEFKNLAISLATFIGKGVASAVNTKIKTIRAENDIEQRSSKYEEIINELLLEREETLRIAQIYKSEIEKITISEEDMKHLHNSISNALDILSRLGTTQNMDEETLQAIKGLISIDTIKTMQLLGFNYKQAIGEPLTVLCSEKISSLGKSKTDTSLQGKKKK